MHPMFDQASLDEDGFVLVPHVVGYALLAELHSLTDDLPHSPGSRRGGVRDPFETVGGLLETVRDTPIGRLAADVLGPGVFAVRSILFDKRPDTNWSVAWHRDETVAVAERVEVPGFGPWSSKGRVDHVRAPKSVLDSMVTLRLHLDDTPATNGPLQAISGSHRTDELPADNVNQARIIEANAGDVLVMRPRVLHASSKQTQGSRRRVLHIECASAPLPHPMRWHKRVNL